MGLKPPTPSGDPIFEAVERGQFHEAYELARASAEKGDSNAQLHLGWLFHAGKGVPKDVTAAERWYRLAAESHNPRAEFYLASLFWNSHNFTQAREWFERAGGHGFAPALYHLGRMYRHGVGVDVDRERAREYVERAAALGHLIARRDTIREMLKGARGLAQVPVGLIRLCGLAWSLIRILTHNEHDDAVLRL